MTPPIVQVASGPGWAMVIVLLVGLAAIVSSFCVLQKWLLEKFHLRISEEGQITRVSMAAATQTMRDIRDSCTACQQNILTVVKVVMGELVDRVLMDNRIEHDDTRACLYEIHMGLGREETRTVEKLDQINNTLIALFPQGNPPPVLGVGSQVRDSGVATP